MAAAAGGSGVEEEGRKPTGEETPELRKAAQASKSRYRAFWSALSRMPALSHWPNRPEPFDPSRSELHGYLLDQCHYLLGLDGGCGIDELEAGDYRLLQRIIDAANKLGVIRFDPKTKLWCGMAPPWQRYRERSEIAAERARYHEEARRRCARIRVCEDCGEWFDDDHALRNHCAEHRSFRHDFDPNRIPELR